MTYLPMVSILCATHGRPHYLAELVECFHRQTYAGPSEMVIVNDCPEQQLFCNVPGVRVYNLPATYLSLMRKRRVVASLAHGTVCQFWDDDDIYLPDAIRYGVEHLADGEPASRGWWTLWMDAAGTLTRRPPVPLATITARVVALLGIMDGLDTDCPDYGRELLPRMVKAGWFTGKHVGPRYPAQLIYRHEVPGAHAAHMSSAAYQAAVAAQIVSGELPCGAIDLIPHWSQDYVALARNLDKGGCAPGRLPHPAGGVTA